MELDLNLTITSIIALCAIISPIITTIIDNKYKLKLKRIDDYKLQKRKVLDEFVTAIIDCITNVDSNEKNSEPSLEYLKNYYRASKILLLYFPQIDTKKLDILDRQIVTGEKDFIYTYSKELIQDLAKYIDKE